MRISFTKPAGWLRRSLYLLCLLQLLGMTAAGYGAAAAPALSQAAAEPPENSADFSDTVFEDERFALSVDTETATFLLEDRRSGCFYASSPADRADDPIAKGAARVKLGAVLLITYLDTETRQTYEANCITDSVNKGGFSMRRMKRGVEFCFRFPELGITVPLQIQIIDDCLSVKIPVKKIVEDGKNRLFGVSPVPCFGAGGPADQGYLLVPDGCGGLIYFNNGKTYAGDYNEEVYGADLSDAVEKQGAPRETVHLAAFGLKKNNAAFLGVIHQAQAHASVHASVSGVGNQYNHVYASFALRKQGDYSFDEGWKGTRSFTVYQESASQLDAMEVRYYFPDKPDYTGMAAAYRRYLTAEKGVSASAETQRPLLTVLGAVSETENLIGIPYTKDRAVTTWAEAQTIAAELADTAVFDVRYTAWSKQDIRGTLPDRAAPAACLGTKKELAAFKALLEEKGLGFYPEVAPFHYSRQSFPFQKHFNAVKGVSGALAQLTVFKRSTGYADSRRPVSFYIRPTLLFACLQKLRGSLDTLSLSDTAVKGTDSLNLSDFSEDVPTERFATQTLVGEGLQLLRGSGRLMLSDPNDSWFVYASRIADVPTSTDRIQLIDEDIPFYQLALSGLIPLSSDPINQSPSPEKALYTALATGTAPQYLIGMNVQETGLARTSLDYAIGADYTANKAMVQKGLALYAELSEKLGTVLTDYRRPAEGVLCAQYERGVFIVNLGDTVYTGQGFQLQPGEYIIAEGEKLA